MFFSTGANNAHGRGSAAAPPRLRPGAAAPSSSGPERGLGGSRHAGGALRNSGAGAGAACEGKLLEGARFGVGLNEHKERHQLLFAWLPNFDRYPRCILNGNRHESLEVC